MLIVLEFIAILNVAETRVPLLAMPVVLVGTAGLPLVGFVAVTVGIVTPTAQDGFGVPGVLDPGGGVPVGGAVFEPSIGDLPPPHPAIDTDSSMAKSHINRLE